MQSSNSDSETAANEEVTIDSEPKKDAPNDKKDKQYVLEEAIEKETDATPATKKSNKKGKQTNDSTEGFTCSR